MVGYLTIIDDLVRIAGNVQSGRKGQGADDPGGKLGKLRFHIVRQKTAVGTRIGDQLFFVQGLGIFQRLLGSKSKDPVGVPLKGGQVIKHRRFFRSQFMLYPLHHRRGMTAAGVCEVLRCLPVFDAF